MNNTSVDSKILKYLSIDLKLLMLLDAQIITTPHNKIEELLVSIGTDSIMTSFLIDFIEKCTDSKEYLSSFVADKVIEKYSNQLIFLETSFFLSKHQEVFKRSLRNLLEKSYNSNHFTEVTKHLNALLSSPGEELKAFALEIVKTYELEELMFLSTNGVFEKEIFDHLDEISIPHTQEYLQFMVFNKNETENYLTYYNDLKAFGKFAFLINKPINLQLLFPLSIDLLTTKCTNHMYTIVNYVNSLGKTQLREDFLQAIINNYPLNPSKASIFLSLLILHGSEMENKLLSMLVNNGYSEFYALFKYKSTGKQRELFFKLTKEPDPIKIFLKDSI